MTGQVTTAPVFPAGQARPDQVPVGETAMTAGIALRVGDLAVHPENRVRHVLLDRYAVDGISLTVTWDFGSFYLSWYAALERSYEIEKPTAHIVVRPHETLPAGVLPDEWDGAWFDRHAKPYGLDVDRGPHLVPTSRLEVRDDGLAAQVWELRA